MSKVDIIGSMKKVLLSAAAALLVVITPLVPSTALAQTTGLPTYTATEAAKHARRPAPTQQMRFYPASW